MARKIRNRELRESLARVAHTLDMAYIDLSKIRHWMGDNVRQVDDSVRDETTEAMKELLSAWARLDVSLK